MWLVHRTHSSLGMAWVTVTGSLTLETLEMKLFSERIGTLSSYERQRRGGPAAPWTKNDSITVCKSRDEFWEKDAPDRCSKAPSPLWSASDSWFSRPSAYLPSLTMLRFFPHSLHRTLHVTHSSSRLALSAPGPLHTSIPFGKPFPQSLLLRGPTHGLPALRRWRMPLSFSSLSSRLGAWALEWPWGSLNPHSGI